MDTLSQNLAYILYSGCSILEGLAEKNGVPVSLNAFRAISSCSLSFIVDDKNYSAAQKTILPDRNTYKKVREYAEFIKSEVEKGNTSVFNKTLTLREFSSYLSPEW